ncbi:unnamed protein product [Schistosoma margrebowiei]|uniref:Uncharacterized protein n=1 Tax=Schistosoma margrebowiei TaxID=48269 RepID=A0A3P7ZTF4_9TREM|nr:unnamed protein product [Schistosoma margrebowiei]
MTSYLYLPVLNKRIDCTIISDFWNIVRNRFRFTDNQRLMSWGNNQT